MHWDGAPGFRSKMESATPIYGMSRTWKQRNGEVTRKIPA